MTKELNIIGNVYDHYEVIGKSSIKEVNGARRYYCLCKCGELFLAPSYKIRNGTRKDCGCGRSKRLSARNKIEFGRAAKNQAYYRYKQSAMRRCIEFNLSFEEFEKLSAGACYYCGDEPSLITKTNNGEFIRNGIDRVDNSRGYSVDNCVSCCKHCNVAKLSMTKEDFLRLVEKIYNNHFNR